MGHPIRILQVVVNMNRGGAETLIMNLYRNMDRSKIQFDFLTCKAGNFDEEIRNMGGIIHRIPYITDVGHFRYIRALNNFFSAHPEYQIVHAHMDKMSGFVLREAKQARVPIRISHSHNTQSEGGFAAKSYKWYSGRFILRDASHFFACSKKAAEWLYGDSAERAVILKNGIDFRKFRFSADLKNEAREELKLGRDSFVIGHVGRFCRQKNHSILLDIFSEIDRLKSNSFLVLVGDGPLKANIEKKAKQLGLSDKVKFLGVRNDIHRLLSSFDAMMFPSLHEGLPVTLIEAQSAGLPCMISDVITEEVDLGANLIHFESLKKTPRIWAEDMVHFVGQKQSRFMDIQDQGYEIRTSAAWMQNFYLQAYGISGEEGIS